MNRSTQLARIRFMLGRHADVLDLACTSKEVAEIDRELGFAGNSDDNAEEFALGRVREAVAAFEKLIATDRKARAFGERYKVSDAELDDLLEQIQDGSEPGDAAHITAQVSALRMEGSRA